MKNKNQLSFNPIGVVNINKPKGVSSSFVVVKLKKILGIKKVGHMGTLDPLASGVLPICIGKATRLFEYFLKKQKSYIATFKFGEQTDTLDLEGKIVKTSSNLPSTKQIEDAIKVFLGTTNQVPPMYSSKKVGGQVSYDLARKNINVDLKPVPITIYEYRILNKLDENTYSFLISCSAGTYIRALARDLGEMLSSCATMTNLVRIKSGEFKIEDSLELENLTKETLLQNIIPLEVVLKDFESLKLNDNEYRDLLNGLSFKPKVKTEENVNYALFYKDRLFGIGKIEYGNLKLKTYFGD